MAKKKEEKSSEAKAEESKNIVEEEKSEEKTQENDYNSIFDDDYVEEEKKEAKTSEIEKSVPEPDTIEKAGSVEKESEIKPQKKTKKSKGFPTKKVLISSMTVFLLLLGAYLATILFKQKEKPKVEATTTTTIKQEIKALEKNVYITAEGGLNMRKEPSSTSEVLAVIPNGTKLSVLEEKDGWYKTEYDNKIGWVSKQYTSDKNPLVYENRTYGFQLTFPEGWSNYKVVEQEVDNGDGTKAPVLYVGVKVSDPNNESTVGKGYADMFAISALTPAQWNTEQNGEGPKSTYITQNSKYVFTWSPSQAGPQEVAAKRDQMKDIIKTFKLL